MRNYTESEVVASLNKKHDVDISTDSKEVRILKGKSASCDIGIKSKGKIDFLHSYCGYTVGFVNSFK